MSSSKPLYAAIGALLVIASPAFGQERLAPTRSYNSYKSTPGYTTYSNTPANRPDRSYGMPSFGTQGAETPEQKTLATRLPPTAGPSAATKQPSDVDLGFSQGHGRRGEDLSSPPAAQPEAGANAGTGTAAQPDMDFFSGSKPPKLNLRNHVSRGSGDVESSASDADTPMFTTPDGVPSDKAGLSGTTD